MTWLAGDFQWTRAMLTLNAPQNYTTVTTAPCPRCAQLEAAIREVLQRTQAGYFTRKLRAVLEAALGDEHGG